VTRTVHGHQVDVTPCDGLRNHWRVRADGAFVGLISSDTAGYYALPWRKNAPLVHVATAAMAIETLLDATVDTLQRSRDPAPEPIVCETCDGEGGWYDGSRQWETCYLCHGDGTAPAGSATPTTEDDDG
jgi:cytochrome c5